MTEIPNIVFPSLTPANQALADALASIDDAREMLSTGSAERTDLDELHQRLDAFALRSLGVPASLLQGEPGTYPTAKLMHDSMQNKLR